MLGGFQALYDNVKRLILRNCQYLTFQLFVGQFANFFPLLAAAPRYFSGTLHADRDLARGAVVPGSARIRR